MSIWSDADEENKKRLEMEMRNQYGLDEEEEENESWLAKVAEYLKKKKADSSRQVSGVT